MKKISIPRLEKVVVSLRLLPKALAKRAFLSSLFLMALSLAIGGLLFYKYYTKIGEEDFDVDYLVQFNESVFQNFLEQKKVRVRMFKKIDNETYPNPFAVPQSAAVEPSAPVSISSPEATTSTPEELLED